jgi:hypothetical protein
MAEPLPDRPPLDLLPPEFYDPVIEAYKKDVDRTLLRENLKLTVDERFRKFESFMQAVYELREAGRKSRMARYRELLAELQVLLEEPPVKDAAS